MDAIKEALHSAFYAAVEEGKREAAAYGVQKPDPQEAAFKEVLREVRRAAAAGLNVAFLFGGYDFCGADSDEMDKKFSTFLHQKTPEAWAPAN